MTALDLPLDAAAAYGGVTVLRATAVLIGAVALAALLGGSSAAARHSLWSVTVCALMALPLLQWAVPAVSVPVPWLSPEGMSQTAVVPEHRLGDVSLSAVAGVEIPPAFADPGPGPVEGESLLQPSASGGLGVSPVGLERDGAGGGIRSRPVPSDPAGILLLLWLTGVAIMAAPLCLGLWRSRALRLEASRVTTPEWMDSLASAAAAVGVTRTVTLHTSAAVRTAMTGGVLRPFVLLPQGAGSWSAERRQVVLLHELIHVRRADAMRQVLGRVALALYWFHPIAWCAVRMASLAREEACDEAVLALGQRPSVYARHLLDLAEPGPLPLPAISLFDRPHLEKRIMRVLAFKAGHRCRRSLLVAPLLGLTWSVMAAAAVPAAPEGDPSPAAPFTAEPLVEMTGGAMPQSAPPADAEAEAQPPFLGLPPGHIASLFADAGWEVGPDRVLPPPFSVGEGASASLRALTSSRDPDDKCLPTPAGGFRIAPGGGADGQARLRTVGSLLICMWSQGAGTAGDLAQRIESLPPGAEVVLAAQGVQGDQRMVISAGPDGLAHTWAENGVERPFDASAREWRDAILTIFDGYAEIDRLRVGEARTGRQLMVGEAILRTQDAARRTGEARFNVASASARAQEVALRSQITALRGQEGLLRQGPFQRMNAEVMTAMATLSSRMSMLQMAHSATQDPVTRERLSAEIESIESTLREQQEQLTAPPSDAQQEEARRQSEEYQRESAAQIAELESRLAELAAGPRYETVAPRYGYEAAGPRYETVRTAESEAVRAEIAATAESLRLRDLETSRRIGELEERIEEAARRLQGSP